MPALFRSVVLAFSLAGCAKGPASYGVPDVDIGMVESRVIDRLGSPTQSWETQVFLPDSAQSRRMSLGMDALIDWGRDALAPGDTILIKRSVWEDRRDWPWESPRKWEVAFENETGEWRVLNSIDTKHEKDIEYY